MKKLVFYKHFKIFKILYEKFVFLDENEIPLIQSLFKMGNFESLADATEELLKGRELVKSLLKKCEKMAVTLQSLLKSNEGGKYFKFLCLPVHKCL